MLLYFLMILILLVIIHAILGKLSIFNQYIDDELHMLIMVGAFIVSSIMPFFVFRTEQWKAMLITLLISLILGFLAVKADLMLDRRGGLKKVLKELGILKEEKKSHLKYKNSNDEETKKQITLTKNTDETADFKDLENVDDNTSVSDLSYVESIDESMTISAETLESHQVLLSHDEFVSEDSLISHEEIENKLDTEKTQADDASNLVVQEVIKGMSIVNILSLASNLKEKGEFDKVEELYSAALQIDIDNKSKFRVIIQMCKLYTDIGQEELAIYILKGFMQEYRDVLDEEIMILIRTAFGDEKLEVTQ